jgi:hypothetical protein
MRKFTVVFALFAFAGTLMAADQSAGTWKLDPSKSSGDGVPKDETMVIADKGDNLQVTITGTAADGTPIAVSYVVPVAGGTGQVSQGPYDSVSDSSSNGNSRDVTYGKNGHAVSKDHETISGNGNTMTVTSQGKDAQGNPSKNTQVYTKQ